MFFRRKEGRELAYKGSTWLDSNMAGDTVTGRQAEERRAFAVFPYFLNSLPPWKKLSLALNQTAGWSRRTLQYK